MCVSLFNISLCRYQTTHKHRSVRCVCTQHTIDAAPPPSQPATFWPLNEMWHDWSTGCTQLLPVWLHMLSRAPGEGCVSAVLTELFSIRPHLASVGNSTWNLAPNLCNVAATTTPHLTQHSSEKVRTPLIDSFREHEISQNTALCHVCHRFSGFTSRI